MVIIPYGDWNFFWLPQGKATKFFHSPNLVVTKMVNKYGLVTIFVVTKPMTTNKFQNDNKIFLIWGRHWKVFKNMWHATFFGNWKFLITIRKIVIIGWQLFFYSRPSLWAIETSKRGFVIFPFFRFPSKGSNWIWW